MGELYSALNVPGAVPFVEEGRSIVLYLTVVTVAAMVVLAVVRASTPDRWPILLLLAGAGVFFVATQSAFISPGEKEPAVEMRETVDRLGVDDAAVVQDRFGGVPAYFQFFLPSVEVTPWDGEGAPPEPFVLADEAAPFADRGAEIVALDPGHRRLLSPDTYSVALWVFPGPEQDRLAQAGELQGA